MRVLRRQRLSRRDRTGRGEGEDSNKARVSKSRLPTFTVLLPF